MKSIFVALTFLISAPTWAGTSYPKLAEKGFTSAKICGECHEAIYQGWKESMHANAVKDPIFYPIFLEASQRTAGKSDALCLSCHSPTTRITKKYDLDDPLNSEGITCDFCHSVKEVRLNEPDPFVIEKDKKKWGPLKDIESPFHGIGFAPHFEQSAFCAGCHEYKNEKGVPILETFSEWKGSQQAREGKDCQSCHMPPIQGLPVPPRVKPVKEIYINSHEAVGGHSIEQVKKAVTVKIVEMKRSGEKIHGVVRLVNVGSGHKVPTGMPTRRLVLSLKVQAGGTSVYSEERVFQKILLNPKGEKITKDSDVFLDADKILQDNRLKPGETREEHFTFFAPSDRPLEVETSVYYLYQPRLIQETEMHMELGREKVVLPTGRGK
ncbi:MAG: hypothetical protein HYT76_01145 [Deltaproteobacteria bacterium]|nr:hypothetical protein [Deltaproteobacteria bacterium]